MQHPGLTPTVLLGHLITQILPASPEVGGLENTGGGDDTGDQFRRSDIEAGVEGGAGWVGHAHVCAPPAGCAPLRRLALARSRVWLANDSPGAKHFALVALFDRN